MEVRTLSPKLQEIAEKELNEVPSRTPEDLEHIRQWIEKQYHLTCRTDDQWLLNFLRGSKFSLERTKEKLDNFYTLRSLVPEMFANRDPLLPEVAELIEAGVWTALPNTVDDTGPRIILLDFSTANIDTMTVVNMCKLYFMILDILLLEDDNFVISGMLVWVDYKHFQMGYMLQITPTVMKKCLTCAQECYPGRIKGIHYTNSPKIIETVFGIIKAVVSDKIKKRMSMQSAEHMNKFEEFLPKKYWPKEFGGENGSIPEIRSSWKKKLDSYRDWFLEEEKFGANEKLRPKPRTSADIFGVEGAFRKLNID